MPVASITPDIRDRLKELYPEPTSYQSEVPTPSCRPGDPPNYPMFQLSKMLVIITLKKLSRGKGAGPFADTTDSLRDYALFRSAPRSAPTASSTRDPTTASPPPGWIDCYQG